MRRGSTSAEPGPSGRALRSPALLLALLAAFALLALLVEAGALARLDQYSLTHLMPALQPARTSTRSQYAGLYSPYGANAAWWTKILDLWTYPCSVLVSGLAVAATLLVAHRRGRSGPALALAAAWVAGNAIELAGKGLIRRPELYGVAGSVRIHVRAFDGSFPSGHMIRGILVAAVLGLLWPRARPWLLAWVTLVAPFLVLSAAHTPSDVVGGLLVGLILVGSASAFASAATLGGGRIGAVAGARMRRSAVPR